MSKIFYISSLLLLTVACVNRAPIPESKLHYVGTWYKDNGCWLKISENGRGGFQMENSYVDGGAVSITENEITIKLFGINSVWRIDKPPYQENGYWLMNLTGNSYEKQESISSY